MELNKYQEHAKNTKIYPKETKIIYPALGLVSEAGEVAGKIKKVLRDDGSFFAPKKTLEIIKELGDVLWYVAVLADDLGYKLNDIAKINIKKLGDRAKRNTLHGSGDKR